MDQEKGSVVDQEKGNVVDQEKEQYCRSWYGLRESLPARAVKNQGSVVERERQRCRARKGRALDRKGTA